MKNDGLVDQPSLHRSGPEIDLAGENLPSGSGERFHLAGEIGVGGAGSIYKAWDEVLGKYVALKMVGFFDPILETRLRREAAIAQSLTHPSIVRIHDVVSVQGRTCLSMEYVEGPDLAEYLRAQGQIQPIVVSRIAEQICAGLQAAHQVNIIHCDLKPSNLVLDGDRVRIIDFGLAVQTDSPHAPQAGDGTPAYMSPEQKQHLPIDCRTDFFSLGLILFELLCGRRATPAELAQVSEATLRRPLPHVPRRLRCIVAKCLQCRPKDRYAEAGEILSDLQRSRLFRHSRKQFVLPAFLRRRRKQPVESEQEVSFRLAWAVPAILCLWMILPWNRWWTAAAGYRPQAAASLPTVALLPFESDNSLQPLTDGLDDYLRAALGQFPGCQVWTPAPRSHPSRQALTQASLVVTGQVRQVGEYFTVHLTAEQGATHAPLFSLTVSAKTAFELEDRLWDRFTSEPQFSRFAAGAVKPLDYCQRRTESGLRYLRANSLIRLRRNEKELHEAVDLLNRALAEDPRCTLCYARKAAAELKLCDWLQDPRWLQDVLSDVQQAQEINENSEPVMLAAAQAYARTGRRKEAILLLRRAEQVDVKSAEIRRALGGILSDEGLYAEALAELKRSRQLNPLDIRSLNTLGATELLVPDYGAAIRAFTQLSALDPAIPYARANLASAYLRAGRFPEAVTALETVIEQQPGAANYSNLGMALFFTGRSQLGLPLFEKAAALEPTSEMYMGNLAHAYRWLQAGAPARDAYQKAIELAQREAQTMPSGRVWSDLGLYYAALGDAGRFHRYFQQARAESPSDLDVLYKEAVAASLLGLSDRSLELLRKVCERGYPMAVADGNPDFAAVRQLPEFSSLKRLAAPTD